MNRRTFLATAGVAAQAQAARGQNAIINVPDLRVYSLNRNWLFFPKASPGAEAAAFNDSAFQRVTLPHSNIELPWHSFDDAAYEFVSAYRRHFRVPESWRGKRVFVDFAGAMTASKVFINGHSFEEYRGGYTPFSFELTPYLNFGGVNLLAVMLDSTERADIPPFGRSIDYLTFGASTVTCSFAWSPPPTSSTSSPSQCALSEAIVPSSCVAIWMGRSRILSRFLQSSAMARARSNGPPSTSTRPPHSTR